jgi:hypothetical protein
MSQATTTPYEPAQNGFAFSIHEITRLLHEPKSLSHPLNIPAQKLQKHAA